MTSIEALYSETVRQLHNVPFCDPNYVWPTNINYDAQKVCESLDSYNTDLVGLLELSPLECKKWGLIKAGGYGSYKLTKRN